MISSIAALLVPLLSIATLSDVPFAANALSKNRLAAAMFRLTVSRKSWSCHSCRRPGRGYSGNRDMSDPVVHHAEPGEAKELSAIAHRAKAWWGYSDLQMPYGLLS